jgi:molybdate transport system substrate-binding protein
MLLMLSVILPYAAYSFFMRFQIRRRALLAATLLLALPAQAQEARRPLAIAAAANLKLAAEALKRGFEAERPGVDVALTFGASGTLFSQVQNGAPFDLFLSADREYPAKVVAARLGAAADERVFAIGVLVAWLPPGSALDLERRGLAALADPAVRRIAIANPAVAPFGRAAEQAFASAGITDAVRPKLVLGTSVAQAAQFATTGAADVAFLPRSLTLGPELAAGRAIPVPEALYRRIEQSGIVLTASKEPALSRAFLDYLTGGAGRAILARSGYGLP